MYKKQGIPEPANGDDQHFRGDPRRWPDQQGAAQCARVYRASDPAFADRCLNAARRAWQAARACPVYTSPSPRDQRQDRMPSSAVKKKKITADERAP
ncbi:glycoside hydrolase family 9 protein [Deinococcus sp. ME38]|uniref:glycoside hydrolase family 9 protein n=1 Tax=Deinococcus sp. ME38 TaxID=3400344 RepID=UPI003B5C40A2